MDIALGDNLVWDYSKFWAPSDSSSMYPLLAGYFGGNRAEPFLNMSEFEIVDEILKLLRNLFTGSVIGMKYRRHFLMNWSKEPFIRGVYSGYAYNDDGHIDSGAVNIRNKLFFAGE